MKSYYQDNLVTIYQGDCREVISSLTGISAVLTDPPYELGFMGNRWDKQGISFNADTWKLIRESCLFGAPLLSFGGTRTSHRIACAVEDAGWEIRDTIMWVYGSGFPKSLNISKAIDRQFGVEREVIGVREDFAKRVVNPRKGNSEQSRLYGVDERLGDEAYKITLPATPEAKLWEGYGTALKPAYEPIILAMNPLDGTFANNALKHKVAGLNIDECRILSDCPPNLRRGFNFNSELERGSNPSPKYGGGRGLPDKRDYQPAALGRFPANFIHDGSQEVMELFPNTGKSSVSGYNFNESNNENPSHFIKNIKSGVHFGDSGSAARFFYCAKASSAERDKGLEDMPIQRAGGMSAREDGSLDGRNIHPTVKPLSLLLYLIKLVKMPEYNLILDPFSGSGTTLLACRKLGIPCIGIEMDEEYCEIAAKRCQNQ